MYRHLTFLKLVLSKRKVHLSKFCGKKKEKEIALVKHLKIYIMKKMLLFSVLLLTNILYGQLLELRFYLTDEVAENRFSGDNLVKDRFPRSNVFAIKQSLKTGAKLQVALQFEDSPIDVKIEKDSKSYNIFGKNFLASLEIIDDNLVINKLVINKIECYTEVTKEENDIKILYFPVSKNKNLKIGISSNGISSKPSYTLSGFTSLSQANDFIDLWGREANENIQNPSGCINMSSAIFKNSVDWHSSVHGHLSSMFTSNSLDMSGMSIYPFSMYTSQNVTLEKNKQIAKEKMYGWPFFLIYATYLKKHYPEKYMTLKPLADALFANLVNYYPTMTTSFFKNSLNSGYNNANFMFYGMTLYAKATGNFTVYNDIRNYVITKTGTVNYQTLKAKDFLEPKAVALLLYSALDMQNTTLWNNVTGAYAADSLSSSSSFTMFSASHSVGLEVVKAWGAIEMYKISGNVRYLDFYINQINKVYQYLKTYNSILYFGNLGHWVPHFGVIAFLIQKDELNGNPFANFEIENASSLSINNNIQLKNFSLNADSYYWTFTGANLSNSSSENPMIKFSQPGTYNITLHALRNGKENIITKSVTILNSMNKNFLASNIDLQIFPNPATKGESLKISTDDSKLGNIKIVDTQGSVVFEKNNCVENSIVLNIKSLNSGIYFIIVATGHTTFSKKLIIKN